MQGPGIYGAGHFYRTMPADYLSGMGDDIGIVSMLESDYPGRTLAVIPLGGRIQIPPGAARPRSRLSKVRPRFEDAGPPSTGSAPAFAISRLQSREFMGRTIFNCRRPGRMQEHLSGSPLTLGQMANACVYVGADVDTKAKAGR